MKSRMVMLAAAAYCSICSPSGAADPVRLGIANDQSSLFSSLGGPGSVTAARMAAEDFGGTVLGRPIEVLSGDTLNKPDVALSFVKEWFDRDGVSVVLDGSASSVGLALQSLAKQEGKIYLDTGGVSSEFIGASCTSTTLQFMPNTRGLAIAGLRGPLSSGIKTWFFITADYAFGNTLQTDATAFITAHGGRVLGAAKHPLGTSDMSSYLLAAQTSGAQGIIFANAGGDLINTVKQAHEFGLIPGPAKIVALFMSEAEVSALGLDMTRGLLFATAVDWNRDAQIHDWTKRFEARQKGQHPTMVHAMTYSAALAYLAAVQAVGTADNDVVVKRMHEAKINDLFLDNVDVRADGRVMDPLYLAQVTQASATDAGLDPIKVLATFEATDLYPTTRESTCPFFNRTTRSN
jgi:branched-chain amino acid transport system substrate-binding protein